MSALEVVMMKRIGELNEEVKGLQAEVERLTKAHSDALADFWAIHKGYFDLKAEVERLRASSFVTAVPSEEYEKLKAEVERLKAEPERLMFLLNNAYLANDRLRKAGDELRDSLPYIVDERLDDKTMRKIMKRWNAAKEGKQS